MKFYYRIAGINHHRYVGIAKDNGKAYDFYLANIDGYREPQTADEMADCQRAGQEYWNECNKWGTTTGEFGLIQVHRQRRGEGQL